MGDTRYRFGTAARCRAIAALACAAVLLTGLPSPSFGNSHEAQLQRKRSRLSQTQFFTMKPFTLPIFNKEAVVAHYTLVIAIELADEDKRDLVYNLVPKVRDAMYQMLLRVVTFRRRGSPLPTADDLKKSLFNVALDVLGAKLVRSLLVQQAFKRRLR